MKKILILIVLLAATFQVSAQDDPRGTVEPQFIEVEGAEGSLIKGAVMSMSEKTTTWKKDLPLDLFSAETWGKIAPMPIIWQNENAGSISVIHALLLLPDGRPYRYVVIGAK